MRCCCWYLSHHGPGKTSHVGILTCTPSQASKQGSCHEQGKQASKQASKQAGQPSRARQASKQAGQLSNKHDKQANRTAVTSKTSKQVSCHTSTTSKQTGQPSPARQASKLGSRHEQGERQQDGHKARIKLLRKNNPSAIENRALALSMRRHLCVKKNNKTLAVEPAPASLQENKARRAARPLTPACFPGGAAPAGGAPSLMSSRSPIIEAAAVVEAVGAVADTLPSLGLMA
eukprot:1161958-Pelagomonas_calceolata.AAC.5